MTQKIRTLRKIGAWPLPLATIIVAVIALSLGCTQEPTAPDYANPLDPDGPAQGDPFLVLAGYINNTVIVSWTGLDMIGIVSYEVLHSLSATGPFSVAGSVEYPATSYSHLEFAPNQANYYKVRAADASGATSGISQVQAAEFLAPPLLLIGETTTTASRNVDLMINVAIGDRVEVDSLSDFSTATSHDFDDNGDVTIPWNLGDAAETGEWKYLFLRVYTGEAVSGTYADSVEVDFAPDLHIEGSPAFVGTMQPTLAIEGDGLVEMRFADSRDNLPLATWLPGDTLYTGYMLTALADSQVVFGEFSCDFGFTNVDSFWAVPDSLNDIALLINNGAESTGESDVQLNTNLAATGMRFAETVGELAVTPWQDYESAATFTHSGCAGDLVKTVHAQFRNDWFDPDPVSDDIQWLPPEVLDITISAADTVSSEEVVALTGTAVAGTCTDPLDGIEFDDGSGWVAATGLEEWSIDWTAPLVVEHTTVTLNARVLAGAAADTVVVDVVVAP
jgi:hypothetical protein